MGYSLVHLDDIEPAGPGGAVRFVRRELGVQAFGINWYELAPGTVGREHDETDTGQEEVNVVVRGSGIYRIDGEGFLCGKERSCASIPRASASPSPARRA